MTANIRREQAEADLCMEPLPDLARSVLDFFRHRSVGHFDSLLDVTAAFNQDHPEQSPVSTIEMCNDGVVPLMERGWLTRFIDGWQLTESGRRSKP